MSERHQFVLGQIARFQRGVTWSKIQEISEPESDSVPVLRIPNIQERLDTSDLVWLKGIGKASIQKCAAAKDWILMVGSNGNPKRVGNCVFIKEPSEFLFASFLIGIDLTCRDKITPEFLFRLLRGPEVQRYISDDVQGSTGLSNINLTRLKAKVVECPSLSEQYRIAEILSTVDETIEQTEALIAKYQQIKSGLMHDLFTQGVTPEGKLRPSYAQSPNLYKKSPLGWIPKEWKIENLGLLAEIVSGVTLGSKNDDGMGLEVPYLRVANVQDGYLDLSEIKTIRVSPSQLEKLTLKDGDVLMNEGGDFDKLGRGTVWRNPITPCIHQNHVFRVRPNPKKLGSNYLAYWSQSEFGKKYFIMNSKQSTNLASINSTQLHRFPIAVPSTHEQDAIEERISAHNSYMESISQDIAKLRQQKQGLMHDLLTGRVRVSGKDENISESTLLPQK